MELPEPTLGHAPAAKLRLDLSANTITWLDASGKPTAPEEPERAHGLPVDTVGSLAVRYKGASKAHRLALLLEPTRVFGVYDEAMTRETAIQVRGSIGDPAGDAARLPKQEGDPGSSVSRIR